MFNLGFAFKLLWSSSKWNVYISTIFKHMYWKKKITHIIPDYIWHLKTLNKNVKKIIIINTGFDGVVSVNLYNS